MEISIKWTASDIMDTYNVDQALAEKALIIAEQEHDAEIGINWDVFEVICERLLKERELNKPIKEEFSDTELLSLFEKLSDISESASSLIKYYKVILNSETHNMRARIDLFVKCTRYTLDELEKEFSLKKD